MGDQQATLLLWHRYPRDIRSWIDAGARVILPLQAGSLSAGELLQEAIGLLGTKAFCTGIPSNLAAMTAADCRTLEHSDYHILGRVVITDELRDKVQALLAGNDGATISSDANWLTSRTRQIVGAVEMLRGTPNLLQTRRDRAVKALLKRNAFGSLDQLAPRLTAGTAASRIGLRVARPQP
ncbi:hypothetical protein PPL19_22464 [Pseudomonas psychrotolerans L19]|nr:hypothetical protein PPL19_22464 [Pseudomonas psychrotolerans L19]